MTLSEHVSLFKNMLKWMIEFLRKFEKCDFKIARVNSIFITKCINLVIYLNFVRRWGSFRSKAIFSAQSIYREICGNMYMSCKCGPPSLTCYYSYQDIQSIQ